MISSVTSKNVAGIWSPLVQCPCNRFAVYSGTLTLTGFSNGLEIDTVASSGVVRRRCLELVKTHGVAFLLGFSNADSRSYFVVSQFFDTYHIQRFQLRIFHSVRHEDALEIYIPSFVHIMGTVQCTIRVCLAITELQVRPRVR